MATTIHINPVAPQKLVMTCAAGGSLPDMTLVMSSVLKLKKPTGVALTLAADITAKTQASITLSHVFNAGEVDKVGEYKVYAVHALAVGNVRSDVQKFQAIDSFD